MKVKVEIDERNTYIELTPQQAADVIRALRAREEQRKAGEWTPAQLGQWNGLMRKVNNMMPPELWEEMDAEVQPIRKARRQETADYDPKWAGRPIARPAT